MGLAKPFDPIGPKSGILKCPLNVSAIQPLEDYFKKTENLIPRCITQIYLGFTDKFPNYVFMNNYPF